MEFDELLTIDELLEAISEERPVGEDLREDATPNSVYYELKDVRNSARRKERELSGDDSDDTLSRKTDWKPILQLVPSLLKTRSKDMELVAWYIEALLRFYGFKGLALGFQLAERLLDKYGEALFPQDEDGFETTIAPLVGLNGIDSDGALITPIGSVVLFSGQNENYAAWQYEQAVELEKISDETKKNQRVRSGAVTLEQVTLAAKESAPQALKTIYADLQQAIATYAQLVAKIDGLANSIFIPTSNIKNRLAKCEFAIRSLAHDVVAPPVEQPPDEVIDGCFDENFAGSSNTNQVSAAALNRIKALKMLTEIASFFRKTEPHSPISYSLEQAVRWSEMTLPELLDELITDASAKQQFHKFTGILESKID